MFSIFFFFNDTATTEIYTLSLHDALPISPMHAGMSYRRLEELGGIQWPCPDEDHPGTTFLHARLWQSGEAQGPKAPFSVVIDDPPVDGLDDEFPLRLTTGRRLDSFNTGVQTAGYTSPLRRPEAIEDERAAVDALLGPPESGWGGAAERSAADMRFSRGGGLARERRDLLLPALHALQSRVGWISEGGLNYVCQRLTVPPAEAYG